MALYRARWVSQDGKPLFRDFHSKAEAEAFRNLPRDHLVFVEYYKPPIPFRQALIEAAESADTAIAEAAREAARKLF